MSKELSPRIIVFGVGGAGGNAVDNMISSELMGVEFIVANTDAQALQRSKAPTRIQLGPETTQGLGAGARPEVGAAAAEESRAEIEAAMAGANMVFIAAGMGGGTGTGAAPIIARTARELGILTVGVVTKPFGFEHARRMNIAEEGVAEIRQHVDTLIVVPNQNLFRVANERTPFSQAFRMVDDVLYAGVRGITDLMVMPGLINLDFADVRAVMAGMGTAMMGMGEAEGEGRALAAARAAIENPLLDDISMKGAKGVLINITGGYDMTLFELDEAANEIRAEVDPDANVIIGSAFDETLEGRLRISVVAAGVGAGFATTGRKPEAAVAAADAADAFIAPKVVTSRHAAGSDADPRADFEGRILPARHIEARDGSDQVAADAAFQRTGTFAGAASSEKPAATRAKEAANEDGPAAAQPGFSSLFGWRKPAGEDADANETGTADTPEPEHPEPAPFDDSDLEIPAFLRRSANH